MKTLLAAFLLIIAVSPAAAQTQLPGQSLPDAPVPAIQNNRAVRPAYSRPTQTERFRYYLTHTFGAWAVVEASVRGGVSQARDIPSQWPEGAEGYGERTGSAFGQIVARHTSEYLVATICREDLRFIPRSSGGSESKLQAAFEDTFLARKGEDGHKAISIARLVGPAAGSTIAIKSWYPSGYTGADIGRETAISYGFQFVRNLLRESRAH